MTIAAVAITIAIIGGLRPGLDSSISTVAGRQNSVDDSISSAIEIVEVTTESGTQVDVWVKNIGGATIRQPSDVIVRFGPEGDEAPFYNGAPGCAAPCWEFAPNSADPWEPSSTIGLRINASVPLVQGDPYVVRALTRGQHQASTTFFYDDATPTPSRTPTVTPTATPTPTATSTPTATPTPVCVTGSTSLLNPTSQIVDTGGDGNGFETGAVNGFADDTAFALNLDGAADRHRYFDYSLSYPSNCQLLGISVRLDWWLDSTLPVSSLSAELSWDAGTTWTAAFTDSVESTTEHTATLGGAANTWGRSWTLTEFSNANFRVRLTSNSIDATRDFFLDWVAVELHYGP